MTLEEFHQKMGDLLVEARKSLAIDEVIGIVECHKLTMFSGYIDSIREEDNP